MSITYKIEIDNEKIENFYDLIEKVFSAVMDCGREIIKKYMEKLDINCNKNVQKFTKN